MVALQLQIRRSFADLGFVDTSSAAIAAVKSAILFVVIDSELLAVLGVLGDAVRFLEDFMVLDLTLGR